MAYAGPNYGHTQQQHQQQPHRTYSSQGKGIYMSWTAFGSSPSATDPSCRPRKDAQLNCFRYAVLGRNNGGHSQATFYPGRDDYMMPELNIVSPAPQRCASSPF